MTHSLRLTSSLERFLFRPRHLPFGMVQICRKCPAKSSRIFSECSELIFLRLLFLRNARLNTESLRERGNLATYGSCFEHTCMCVMASGDLTAGWCISYKDSSCQWSVNETLPEQSMITKGREISQQTWKNYYIHIHLPSFLREFHSFLSRPT